MAAPEDSYGSAFRHEALFYSGEDEFLEGTVSFVWLVNQLSDVAQVRSLPSGNVVRLHIGLS